LSAALVVPAKPSVKPKVKAATDFMLAAKLVASRKRRYSQPIMPPTSVDGLAGYPIGPVEVSRDDPVTNRSARLNTIAASMAAFDKLPRRVRVALASGVENWSPQAITLVMRGRGIVDFGAVDIIETWNTKELRERDRHRAAAIGVYRGNLPG
jgi:hypothetical protein